jgi:hypothetical protein
MRFSKLFRRRNMSDENSTNQPQAKPVKPEPAEPTPPSKPVPPKPVFPENVLVKGEDSVPLYSKNLIRGRLDEEK